jgi:predicted ABC-type ATPase
MNIEDFKLSQDEFSKDKSAALLEFLIECKPVKNPIVTFVVGQPGAGKTSLAILSQSRITTANEGVAPINVDADRIAMYHRYYNRLLDFEPEERFNITREFVNPAIKEIQTMLSEKQISMIIECTLNTDKKLKFMRDLKEKGYKVNVNVLVVTELESRLSCLEREALFLKMRRKIKTHRQEVS